MSSKAAVRSLPLLSMVLLAGCLGLVEGAFTQQPLTAGSDWERARQVGNAPWTAFDPAVARLTPLVKKDPEENLQKLVDALMAGRRDEFEKVKAIHDWVTRNISYDFSAFQGKTPTIVDPYGVLRHGSSVCQGYSELFAQMCTMAGIESRVVAGYGRGYGFDPFTEDDRPYQTNHAWNAVLINGGWYLVDATWDSGGLEGQETNFTFKWQYSTGFLFTPPDIFLCTHFPDDPRWQLRDQPLDLAHLRALPPLWGDFGTLGFSLSGNAQRLTNVGETQELSFRVPPDVKLHAFLTEGSAAGQDSQYQVALRQTADVASVKVMFPRPGRYGLALNGYKDPQMMKPILLGELFFISSGGSQERGPLIFTAAKDTGLSLDGEYGYAYRVKGTTSFSFSCDGNVMVSLADRSNKTYQNRVSVTRNGSRQVATVSFPGAGEYRVTLAVQSKTDPNSYNGVASLSYVSEGGGDLEFPYMTSSAISAGATLDAEQGYNPKVAGETQFSLRIHGPVIASLMDSANKGIAGHAFLVTDGDLKTVKVSFPGPGSYTVWVSAPVPGNDKRWEGIASLHFEASSAGRVFPTQFTVSGQPRFKLIGPMDGQLKAGQDVTIEVSGPAAGVVRVQSGSTNIALPGDGGHFKATVRPAAGKLLVFGGLGSASMEAIAEYQVK